MHKFQKLKQEPWFELAFAGCIVTIFYLLWSNLGYVLGGIGTFFSYFATVINGIILAYLINSPAKFLQKNVFKNVKDEKKRWVFSVLLAVFAVLAFLLFSMMILIPQLLESVGIFLSNLPSYANTMHEWLKQIGLSNSTLGNIFGNDAIQDGSNQMIDTIVNYVISNSTSILNKSATAGKGVFNFVIAFILSLYFLMDKSNVTNAVHQLLRALQKPSLYKASLEYFKKCDLILSRYVVYNIIDSLIVGSANAVFQTICGIPYVGLISFVVGITNLIPTFGPVIGAVIGGFILLMVNPMQVIIFLIFTLVLQTCDGYVIKPKLFGNSLGVSGMLIIVGVIVGGKIGGIPGILFATPVVAILDFTWRGMIFPRLVARRARIDAAAAAEQTKAAGTAAPADPSDGSADKKPDAKQ